MTLRSAEDTTGEQIRRDLRPAHFVASWFWYPQVVKLIWLATLRSSNVVPSDPEKCAVFWQSRDSVLGCMQRTASPGPCGFSPQELSSSFLGYVRDP